MGKVGNESRGEGKKDFHCNSHKTHNPNPGSYKRIGGSGNLSSVASGGKQKASRNGEGTEMVQHNDKWKKKATREYHKKHGTHPAGRGRGRGRGISEEVP
jgi:hypothetical protein